MLVRPDDKHGAVFNVGYIDIAGNVGTQAVAQWFVAESFDSTGELLRQQPGVGQVLEPNPVEPALIDCGKVEPFACRIERDAVDTPLSETRPPINVISFS